MDPAEYRPLKGRVAGPMYSARLYRGPDYLLKTTVQGLHEHFRRFAWEDIQAFIVEETPWRGVANLMLGLVLGMQLVSLLTISDKTAGILLTYATFMALLAALIAINHFRGPTCKTFVQTAVSRERLWSLNRVRIAREVIDTMVPLILERQAASAGPQSPSAGDPTGSDADPRPSPGISASEAFQAGKHAGYPVGKTEKPLNSGALHLVACVFLAIFTVDSVEQLLFHFDDAVWNGFTKAVFIASSILCLTMLIVQARRRTPRPLRVFAYLTMGYHVFNMLAYYGVMLATLIASAKDREHAKHAARILASSGYRLLVSIELLLELALLVFGVIGLLRHKRNLKAAESLAQAESAAATGPGGYPLSTAPGSAGAAMDPAPGSAGA
jgi:hypothetical protein